MTQLTRIKDLFPDLDKDAKLAMFNKGVVKQRRHIQSARDRGAETETCYGQRLMREFIPRLTAGLKDWLETRERYAKHSEAFKKLDELNQKVVSFIALRSIVDVLSQRRTFASASIRVGAMIEDEARFQ